MRVVLKSIFVLTVAMLVAVTSSAAEAATVAPRLSPSAVFNGYVYGGLDGRWTRYSLTTRRSTSIDDREAFGDLQAGFDQPVSSRYGIAGVGTAFSPLEPVSDSTPRYLVVKPWGDKARVVAQLKRRRGECLPWVSVLDLNSSGTVTVLHQPRRARSSLPGDCAINAAETSLRRYSARGRLKRLWLPRRHREWLASRGLEQDPNRAIAVSGNRAVIANGDGNWAQRNAKLEIVDIAKRMVIREFVPPRRRGMISVDIGDDGSVVVERRLTDGSRGFSDVYLLRPRVSRAVRILKQQRDAEVRMCGSHAVVSRALHDSDSFQRVTAFNGNGAQLRSLEIGGNASFGFLACDRNLAVIVAREIEEQVTGSNPDVGNHVMRLR